MTDTIDDRTQRPPPFPGEPTTAKPRAQWSALEAWVWERIGSGQTADISRHLSQKLDPRLATGWTVSRRLSNAFMQTIICHEPYRSALPRHGIEIFGAWFDEPIDLRDARLLSPLWLHQCRFEKDIGFNGLRSESVVSFTGSVFEGNVDMREISIDGGLYLRRNARLKTINLYGARIGRNLNIGGSSLTGSVNLSTVTVGGNLVGADSVFEDHVRINGTTIRGMVDLQRSHFKDRLDMWWLNTGQDLLMGGTADKKPADKKATYTVIDAHNAKIGGQLNLCNSEVGEALNLQSITIANELLLEHHARFAVVNLRLAKVGQHASLSQAHIADRINLTAAMIERSLFLTNATIPGKVDLVFAEIGSNLELCGGHFADVDLTGTKIGGELRLATDNAKPEWSEGAHLVLRNASADALHDTPSAWPEKIELDGFVYHRFGGLNADADHDLFKRGPDWFVKWLAKDSPHTPQPYRQCASVLSEMGHPEMAEDVLYAGRERDREEVVERGDHLWAIGLWLLKNTIGYGHGAKRYFHSLKWIVVFVLLGVLVLVSTGDWCEVSGATRDGFNLKRCVITENQAPALVDVIHAASYSLNKLLPVINLPRHHETVTLDSFSQIYFQLHKLLGYVLALFLLAGITGLTRK